MMQRSLHGRRLTRRSMLLGTAGLAAAATLSRAVSAADAVGPVMARLSAYMSEAGRRALPEQIVLETKYHILDTLAAMVSGSELPPGEAALRFARAYGGGGNTTIVASNLLLGPIEAAIITARSPRPTR